MNYQNSNQGENESLDKNSLNESPVDSGSFGFGGGMPEPSANELAAIEKLKAEGGVDFGLSGDGSNISDLEESAENFQSNQSLNDNSRVDAAEGVFQEVEGVIEQEVNDESSFVNQNQSFEEAVSSSDSVGPEFVQNEEADFNVNEGVYDEGIAMNRVFEGSEVENLETSDKNLPEESVSDFDQVVDQETLTDSSEDVFQNAEIPKEEVKKKDDKSFKTIFLIVLIVLLIALCFGGYFFARKFIFTQVVIVLVKNFWWLLFPVPIWLIFRLVWGEYSVVLFAIAQKFTLLEVRPSADVEKSPKIMEQVFTGLHTWSTPNKLEQYCGWRPLQDKYSFEIVSTEGTIHFYLRCPAMARNNVEAQIYAQYPDCEIFEVDDYTQKVPANLPNVDWDVWGAALAPIQNEALPIKTHIHFVEDVTGKMIDPLASMIEVMSSIERGQHIWFQINFSPQAEGNWIPQAQEYLDKLMGIEKKKSGGGASILGEVFGEIFKEVAALPGNVVSGALAGSDASGFGDSKQEPKKEEKEAEFNINKLTPADQEKIKLVYAGMSKPGFDTSIRFVYLGRREGYNKAHGVAGPMGALKQFADPNSNTIIPTAGTKTFANYFFTESRLRYRQRQVVNKYKQRSMGSPHFLFNTDELATLFHFPDMSVQNASVRFKDATKGQAPKNIPIGFEPS